MPETKEFEGPSEVGVSEPVIYEKSGGDIEYNSRQLKVPRRKTLGLR